MKNRTLTLRDLVFLGVLAAVLVGVARAFLPLAVLIGGPVIGPTIVHHSLYAIPAGALVALGYLRVPKPGAALLLGLVFALLYLLFVGQWFVLFGFWSGAALGELALSLLRRHEADRGAPALAVLSGCFMFGLSFVLPLFFALFAGRQHVDIVFFGVALFWGVVPGLLGAVGGLVAHKLAGQFRRAGLLL